MNRGSYSARNALQALPHYLTGRLVGGVASAVTILLIARWTPVEEYARFTSLFAIGTIASYLATLGIERALLKFVPQQRGSVSPRRIEHAIGLAIVVRVAGSAVFLAVGVAIAVMVDSSVNLRLDGLELVICASFTLAMACNEAGSASLQSLMQHRALRRAIGIQAYSRTAAVIVCWYAFSELDARMSLAIYAVTEWLGAGTILAALSRYLRSETGSGTSAGAKGAQSKRITRSAIIGVAASNYGSYLVMLPWQNAAIRLWVSHWGTQPEVAACGLFLSLVERLRVYLPAILLQGVLESQASATYSHKSNARFPGAMFSCAYRLNAVVLIPLMYLSISHGASVLAWAVGGKYDQLSWILLALLGNLLIASHIGVLWALLNAHGQSTNQWRGSLPVSLLGVPVLVVAGQLWGTIGVLAATLTFYGVLNLTLLRVARSAGISYSVRAWSIAPLVIVPSAVDIALRSAIAQPPSVLTTLSGLVVYGAAFVTTLYLLPPLSWRERRLVGAMLSFGRSRSP